MACVTDGAAVMVTFLWFGYRLIECDHQLCYAPGIHLEVCDILHKSSATPSVIAIYDEERESEG